MFRMFRNARKHRGFTLIEAMIVVIIMGIVAGGATLIMGDQAEKAKYNQAEKDLDALLSALSNAYTEAGAFGVVTSNSAISSAFTGTFKTKFENQMSRPLNEIEDPWGEDYAIYSTYNASTKAGTIKVYCTADGGTMGGDPATSSNCRTNKYTNKKMYKRVYNN